MSKTIILIGHKKRQGKDTFAGMLGYPILHFAAPMKEIVAETFGITLEQLEFAKNEGRIKAFLKYRRPIFLIVDFRDRLQQFGSEIMKRQFGAGVWGEHVLRRIEQSNSDIIVIPDFRFKEEYALLRGKHRVVTVNVVRSSEAGMSGTQHVSEIELDDFTYDATVYNEGSLWELKRKAYEFKKEVAADCKNSNFSKWEGKK